MLLWAMALLDLLLLDLQDQSHNLLDRHLEHKNNLILDLDQELNHDHRKLNHYHERPNLGLALDL